MKLLQKTYYFINKPNLKYIGLYKLILVKVKNLVILN